KDGRATSQGEVPAQSILYEAENAYVTLMAGFTTVQSIGSPLDVEVRGAIARGIFPGPRLLTSIRPVTANTAPPDQIRAYVRAGSTAIAHGSQATDEVLKLMAERGTYFEPNIGLVSQNYLENKVRYLGIGNFDAEGFAYTEKGIPMKLEMFRRALKIGGLRLIMGTDAGAGAHGRNAEEIMDRVQ